MPDTHIGQPRNRVDGPAKVTGIATYAAEFTAADLAHGVIVSSAIAKGRIRNIDTAAAEAMAGVLAVITHENRPRTAWGAKNYQDKVAPPGSPFRALYDDGSCSAGSRLRLWSRQTSARRATPLRSCRSSMKRLPTPRT